MSNFIPDLNDPRTRGWGGHEYEYDYGDDRGYFIFSWLGFIVLFALPFTQTPGGILIATLLLWLMLGILTPVYYATSQAGGNLHAPAVICDPQGLTIYDSNQRIEHQWRWQALDSVSARNNGLRIIPRNDEALTYRDFRLGRDMETLLAIAVVATGYLHGRAPSIPPAPSADINHIWYKPQDDIVWLSSSNLLLPVLALAFCWPGLIQYWPDLPQGTITVAIVVGFFDLLEISNHYHRYYRNSGLCRRIVIDNNGLHFLETSNRGSVLPPLSISWTDIAHIEITEEKKGHHTFNYLRITDRLSNYHKRSLSGEEDVWPGREIVAAVEAIIDHRPLPPLTSGKIPIILAEIPPAIRRFFWANVLFTAVVILGYGSCLYLHRCMVPISPQALLALVVAYMTLAAAAFFIELDYRRRTST